MKKKNTTLKQNLSKDMKKQNHVSKRKPSNGKLSSEKELSETPKKGSYREPSSKKLSSDKFLQKSHKLVHLKEFVEFISEDLYSEMPTYSSADKHIANILDTLDISYRMGKDSVGNEGVFLVTLNNEEKVEIYSTHPDEEHSSYNITHIVNGVEEESFKTMDLDKSLRLIVYGPGSIH